MFLMIKKYVKY